MKKYEIIQETASIEKGQYINADAAAHEYCIHTDSYTIESFEDKYLAIQEYEELKPEFEQCKNCYYVRYYTLIEYDENDDNECLYSNDLFTPEQKIVIELLHSNDFSSNEIYNRLDDITSGNYTNVTIESKKEDLQINDIYELLEEATNGDFIKNDFIEWMQDNKTELYQNTINLVNDYCNKFITGTYSLKEDQHGNIDIIIII